MFEVDKDSKSFVLNYYGSIFNDDEPEAIWKMKMK